MGYSIDNIPETLKFRKGSKHSEESKKKMKESRIAFYANGGKHPRLGKKHSDSTKKKMKVSRSKLDIKGEKNPKWIKDRSLLSKNGIKSRWCYAYLNFLNIVKKRDGYKCRINNKDCKGKIEVHHILSYRDYPELHYQPNNGIVLCHAHHPRKRAEEKRLAPILQKLVS